MSACRESSDLSKYGSDSLYDFLCSLCEKDRKNASAIRYCQDCRVYMCEHCTQNHNKFPLNASHELLDDTKFMTVKQPSPASFPKCERHPGGDIKMFCETHETLCCTVCKVLEHSLCDSILHLPEDAESSTSQTETFVLDVANLIRYRKSDRSRVEKEVKTAEQNITDLRKRINNYFDYLEKKSLNELDMKRFTIMNMIESDINYLESRRRKAKAVLQQLKSFMGQIDCNVFPHITESKRMLNDSKRKILEISGSLNKDCVQFNADADMENYLKSLDTMGSYSDMNDPVHPGFQLASFQSYEKPQNTTVNSSTDASFAVEGNKYFYPGTNTSTIQTSVDTNTDNTARTRPSVTTSSSNIYLPQSSKKLQDNQMTSTADISLDTPVDKESPCSSPKEISRPSAGTSISKVECSTTDIYTHANASRRPLPCPVISQNTPNDSEYDELPCAQTAHSPYDSNNASHIYEDIDFLKSSNTDVASSLHPEAFSDTPVTNYEYSAQPSEISPSSDSMTYSTVYENLDCLKASDPKYCNNLSENDSSDATTSTHIYDVLPCQSDSSIRGSGFSASLSTSSLNTSSERSTLHLFTSSDISFGEHHSSRQPPYEFTNKDLSTSLPLSDSMSEDNFIKYKPLPMMCFNVKEKDQDQCNIFDICQLPDGKILLIDDVSKKLKRCDPSYKLHDSIRLSGDPYSVCAAGPGQVAVSLRSQRKIQFIHVGRKLSQGKSFTVSNYCRGMVYVSGNLNVCIGDVNSEFSGQIEVYNNSGQLINRIPKAPQRLHSAIKYIALCEVGQHRFVTMYSCDSVVMLDMEGNVSGTFNHSCLKQPEGICTDGKGHLFVCGYHSNTVVQISPKDKRVELILSEAEGIEKPVAIHYDGVRKRLLVSNYLLNDVFIFTLMESKV